MEDQNKLAMEIAPLHHAVLLMMGWHLLESHDAMGNGYFIYVKTGKPQHRIELADTSRDEIGWQHYTNDIAMFEDSQDSDKEALGLHNLFIYLKGL